MTERPIPFSGPMVRAILAGRKSQTRRCLTPQPDAALDHHKGRIVTRFNPVGAAVKTGLMAYEANDCAGPIFAFRQGKDSIKADISCPYGVPGDRLWVREAWTADFEWAEDVDKRALRWWHEMPAAFRGPANVIYTYYHADDSAWHCHPDEGPAYPASWAPAEDDWEGVRWRPSIHMPRWASRLTLELTNVRVERLQDIGEDDAIDEGCGFDFDPLDDDGVEKFDATPRGHFAQLWDKLHGHRRCGWQANPWVWVLEFRRVDAWDQQPMASTASQDLAGA
jgi:hypothetical protein